MANHVAYIVIPASHGDKYKVSVSVESKSCKRFLDLCACINAFCKREYGVEAEVTLEVGKNES